MFLRGRRLPVWQGGLIVLLVFLAYLPALHGGFIWDDDAHLTANPCIVDPLGFKDIWTSTAANYFPLVLTSFWVQHAIWGLNPMPYHLVNIAMHAAGAVLLWFVLRRLKVRGAWFGAALWGLHPVQTESVAWITELKNTQSGLFYLLAILFFLKWRADGTFAGRKGTAWDYALALLCAVLAILSKTSTVMLPVVLGLVWWWSDGRWRWRNIFRLVPFFIISAAASGWTVWEQQSRFLLVGPAWSQSWPERFVIAGKAVWFYLGKLLWPHPLIFIYPRWTINASQPTAFLPVLALGIIMFLLWLNRRGRAGPVFFAFVYFVVSLFPVLGFFKVFFSRYSFVGDHFQYLASPGPLALAAAGIITALDLFKKGRPFLEPVLCGTLLLVLGTLTWRQAGVYTDTETLWRDTLARNPDCWMAQNNLGTVFADKGRYDEAIKYYRKAIQLNPNFSEAQYGLGLAFAAQGRLDEAIENYRKAIQINPDYCNALNDLGNALADKGRFDEAIGNFRQAIRINPNYAEALNNLGIALADKGRFGEAIEAFRKAIQSEPDFSEALNNLGGVLLNQGRFDEAIENYRKAIQSKPNFSEALDNLGATLAAKGRYDEAIENYRKAIQSKPDFSEALNNLAWVLATSPDAGLRNGAEAVRLAERACELTHYGEPSFIRTLAAAYAEAGRFPEAVTTAEKAVQLATDAGSKKTAEENRQRLELYRTGKPYHEPAPTVR
jgi:tetratricopeptide (TPR) repeat protein